MALFITHEFYKLLILHLKKLVNIQAEHYSQNFQHFYMIFINPINLTLLIQELLYFTENIF